MICMVDPMSASLPAIQHLARCLHYDVISGWAKNGASSKMLVRRLAKLLSFEGWPGATRMFTNA